MENKQIAIGILALFLLACHAGKATADSTSTSQLSAYSWYFEPPQRGSFSTLREFLPACAAAPNVGVTLASSSEPELAQSIKTAQSALNEASGLNDIIAMALSAMKMVIDMAMQTKTPDSIINSMLAYRAQTCNAHAFTAISLTLQSDREAWNALSNREDNFELAIGNAEISGLPAQTGSELSNIKDELDRKSAEYDSLAGKVIYVNEIAGKEYEKNEVLTPVDAWTVVLEGISSDSALSRISNLHLKIGAAIAKLEELHSKTELNAKSAKASAERALKQYSDEDIKAMDGLNVPISISSQLGGSSSTAMTFAQAKTEAEVLVAQADSKMELAKWTYQNKARGYAGESIISFDDATKGYTQAAQLVNARMSAASQLSKTINDELENEVEQAQSALGSIKESDPAAWLSISKQLDDAINNHLAGTTEYERAAKALDAIKLAQKISSAVSNGGGAAYQMLRLEIADAKAMFEKATADGLAVSAEKYDIDSADSASKNRLDLDENQISALEARVAGDISSIKAKFEARYSVIESAYATALEYRQVLGTEDRAMLDGYSRYFSNGKINFDTALGQMHTAEVEIRALSQKELTAAPGAISKMLEQNVHTSEAYSPGLDGTAMINRKYWTMDTFGFDWPESVSFTLDGKPAGKQAAIIGNAALGTDGNLVGRVDSLKAGATYAFEADYSTQFKVTQTESTIFAGLEEARISIKAVVTAEEDCTAIITIMMPEQSGVFSKDGLELVSQSGGKASFRASLTKGRNDFAFTAVSQNQPFRISKKIISNTGATVVEETTFKNDYWDFDSVGTLTYYSEPCGNPLAIKASTSDFGTDFDGAYAYLSPKGSWNFGQTKTVRITYACGNSTWAYATNTTDGQLSAYLGSLLGLNLPASGNSALSYNIDRIEESASNLPESGAILAITSKAKLASTADAANSELAQLDGIIKARLTELAKKCTSTECQQIIAQVKGYEVSKSWPQAIEGLSKAQDLMDAQQDGKDSVETRKRELYDTYMQKTKPEAIDAIAKFEDATAMAVDQPSAWLALRKDGFDITSAKQVKSKLENSLATVDLEPPNSTKFNAITEELLSSQLSDIENYTAALNSMTQAEGKIVGSQIAMAYSGNLSEEDAASLSNAENDASVGKYMSAYLVAKDLNTRKPTPVATSTVGFKIEDYLPVLALVVLGGAGYLYLNREQPKPKIPILEKAPEDFAN